MRRAPALLLAAVGVWLPAWRCPLDATPQEPYRETIEVVEIKVPVQVVRDGAPVRGLSREDFKITAGGKRREIVGFQVVDLATVDAALANDAEALPLPARRHFMLLFDLSFSKPSSIVRARHAAYELVEEGLNPTDLVGVATYSQAFGFKVLLGFTSDHESVLLAIASLGIPAVVRSYLAGAEPVDRRFRPGLADEEIGSTLESMLGESDIAVQRHLAQGFVSSLGELAAAFRAVNGRKHVIYLSEGFPGSLVTGLGVSTESERRQIEAMNEAAMSGKYWQVEPGRRYGYAEVRSGLQGLMQRFVDVDCAVHTVDIGGVRAGNSLSGEARSPGEDTLFMMADETGGEFIRNYNDLTEAMTEVLERTSVTYLMSFRLAESEIDDRVRKIRVKLRHKGIGTRLLYRPSYRITAD